jgi:hypothetical protein
MHNSVWTALLRHLPPEQYDQLMLVTVGGTEIALQTVLRIEQEFMAVKGRLAGSQDAGRVFFIPYAQIDYFGFQQPLKESDFHQLFGTLTLPAPGQAVAADPATLTPEPVRDPPDGEPAMPGSGVRTPIKSAILERFRSRTASSLSLPPAQTTGE